MFDYYKINTGVLPRVGKCTKTTQNKTHGRNYFTLSVNVLLEIKQNLLKV